MNTAKASIMYGITSFDVEALLSTAETAARLAGKLAHDRWNMPRTIKDKGIRDVVTDTDVEAQKVITDTIAGRFPDHGFLTEETDDRLRNDGPITWIIDPIDGTTNYSRHFPVFCVSIAAVGRMSSRGKGNEVLVGIVYDPMRDELFSAVAGQDAWLNGRSIQVTRTKALEKAVVALDWSHSAERRDKAIAALGRFAHEVNTIRAIGSAAMALAWVAAGRIDAYLNFSLQPWDVAAANLLIEEAGGNLTDIDGHLWSWPDHRGSCVASNRLLHGEFLHLVAGERESG
jgi:myo-inositol-1(or 4)-monophosphatase